MGQLTGATNLAGIAGSLLVLVGFRALGFGFGTAFLLAAVAFLASSLLVRCMRVQAVPAEKTRFVIRREYRLFYWLNVLIGLLGGVIWTHLGYEYVFLLGVLIACVNLYSASRVRLGTAEQVSCESFRRLG